MADARIDTDADIAAGVAHLVRVCPVWARVLPDLSPLPLRRSPDGFGAILSAIVGQQISVAAAAAIRARMEAANLTTESAIRAAGDDDLRAAGLSRGKARYLRAVADAGIDWDGLRALPDDQAIATLTALPGIGVWTAEIYLMFALGRPDVLPAADLALQESARMLYDLDARPTPAVLRRLADPWAPWRAVAARGLWAYYRHAKGREGIT
ncbi:DNA-3-methyladenine glycosylase [Paracoccus sp. (in: a-proteobacteria)]|uniref:DNA-3-methyladenine glycosylase family protein n=1 Tax=Paracoccus sp. TaxID=267 RepID=UPI0026E04961|nr:DNA-3-methyladenine glycosylase 2 family protein [Paracoccus sp. (in: a-proteobacteria)]MDO5647859.1 DNA-3-methyladenine glycosylase 2 family protein [Paracoccus sp. (in: a-proteobacteria)]